MRQDITVLRNLSILIVEDDELVLHELEKTASILFKNVYSAKNGQDGFSVFEYESIDIVLTDIKMPILDGMGLVRKIRERSYEIPIVLLSSYSEQDMLLKILNLGVDGYLIKPVEFHELVETLLKATRRYNNKEAQIISFRSGKLFNTLTKELFLDGKNVELGAKELALLELFLKNRDRTISKEEITSTLWPLEEITDSALKGVLNRVRNKIGDEHIRNIKGFGWKFCIDCS